MTRTTESYLIGQIAELQADLVEIRRIRAGLVRTARVFADGRRAQVKRRIADIEARIAQQCQLIATQAAAGLDTTASEALLQDLERVLELTRTCYRLL
ncbi:hypothetical protein [Benzoatithermus flavus]|uniref:Uncharacterized protein n=1 Tax=Benzoatithermus flavus TaxID=3108223 RepID=A0ABU8XKV6_9PROT